MDHFVHWHYSFKSPHPFPTNGMSQITVMRPNVTCPTCCAHIARDQHRADMKLLASLG